MLGYTKLCLVVVVLTIVQNITAKSAKHQRHGKHSGPQLIPTPSNVSVTRGELAVLECAVINLGTKTVIWRKLPYKHPLTIGVYTFIEDPSLTIERNERRNQWNLLIRNVQPHHAGLYECQVSAQEKLIHIVQLRVKDPLPNASLSDSAATSHSDIVRVRVEDPVKLICNITRKTEPPDDIKWYKQGIPLSTDVNRKVYITNYRPSFTKTLISVFTVLKSSYNDTGLYVCEEGKREIKRFKVDVISPYGGTVTSAGNVKREPSGRHQNSSSSSSNKNGNNMDKKHSSASRLFSSLTTPALILYTVWWNLAFS